jgi:hypothetical protein
MPMKTPSSIRLNTAHSTPSRVQPDDRAHFLARTSDSAEDALITARLLQRHSNAIAGRHAATGGAGASNVMHFLPRMSQVLAHRVISLRRGI